MKPSLKVWTSQADLLRIESVSSNHLMHAPDGIYRLLWVGLESEMQVKHLISCPPGTSLSTSFDKKWSGLLVSFPEESLLLWGCQHFRVLSDAQLFNVPDHVTVEFDRCETGKFVDRTFRSLVLEWRCNSQLGNQLLSALMKVLLIAIYRLLNKDDKFEASSVDDNLFHRFIKMIEENKACKKGIQEYAQALSVRTEVLCSAVRKVSGYSPRYHIYEQIIRAAKHAAIGSGASMKQVAYDLGFKDIAHFSKFFHHRVGMTFTDYRKIYQLL